MSFQSKVGEEVYLTEEDIAEILIRGEVWTIWVDVNDPKYRYYIIGYHDVYKYTNLLRVVSEDEHYLLVRPVVPITFEDWLGRHDVMGTDHTVFLNLEFL